MADALASQRATVALGLIGTALQKKVWDALMKIPAGQTRSYTDVAARLGASRAVASARNRVRDRRALPSHGG